MIIRNNFWLFFLFKKTEKKVHVLSMIFYWTQAGFGSLPINLFVEQEIKKLLSLANE